jgi:hypothetical protein
MKIFDCGFVKNKNSSLSNSSFFVFYEKVNLESEREYKNNKTKVWGLPLLHSVSLCIEFRSKPLISFSKRILKIDLMK